MSASLSVFGPCTVCGTAAAGNQMLCSMDGENVMQKRAVLCPRCRRRLTRKRLVRPRLDTPWPGWVHVRLRRGLILWPWDHVRARGAVRAMSTPDATAAAEAALQWGQDDIDVHQGRAAGLYSVLAHGMRQHDGRPIRSAAPGLFVHVVSRPTGALDAIVVVYQMEDHLEVCISSWHMHCVVCGRMAGSFRAERM